MPYVPLPDASVLYECSSGLVVRRWSVHHQLFGDFSQALRELERRLGSNVQDHYWTPFLRRLRRYRFRQSSSLIPFENIGKHRRDEFLSVLADQASTCDQVFPDFEYQVRDIVAQFKCLIDLLDNPLLNCLKELRVFSQMERVAILIKEPGLIPDTREQIAQFSDISDVEVLGPSQLRQGTTYHTIFLIGAPGWFRESEYVFTSPRAPEIHVVKYTWLSDKWVPEIELLGAKTSEGRRNTTSRVRSALLNRDGQAAVEALDPDDLLPKVDWEALKDRVRLNEMDGESSGEETEWVVAKLFILEGDLAVLLEANDLARATTIDMDGENEASVNRIAVLSIEPDMFVLLRTTGGGEYIGELADSILGIESASARQAQRLWKAMLRRSVLSSSASDVAAELKSYGSRLANESNLRNWMSYSSIKTQYYSDFQAIMSLIGLDDQAREYWDLMTMIDSAHRRAGQRIRKMLLSQVKQSDLSPLESTGRMDFEVPGMAGGSLSAFRVIDILPESLTVPLHRIGRLLELGEL